MPAYFVVDVREVNDPVKMEEYRGRVGANVKSFGGRYLAAGSDLEVFEGDWRPTFLVILEFPSPEQARLWYDSEGYRELKELRLAASKCDILLIEGIRRPPRDS